MSMKDSTRLLLKATPELLEGWCGPGKVVWGDGLVEDCVIRTIDGDPHFWTEEVCDWWRASDTDIMRFAIHLDLARAECRDRVTRVVASACGLDASGGTQMTKRGLHEWGLVVESPRGMSAGSPPMDSYARRFHPRGKPEAAARIRGTDDLWVRVPALAAIAPHDDTRLPDGSRLVDALALHAAATEVLHG